MVRLPYVLLFASGFCALLLQTVWVRNLCLFLGHSTASSSVVVGLFMGGLGLGSAWLGRVAERAADPIRLYATLELGVGLWAIVSPHIHAAAHQLYTSTGGTTALGETPALLVRIAIAMVTLGLPAALMGGTLPAMVRAIQPADDLERRTVARLYGINTLGACAGAFFTTFFLLEALGLRFTMYSGGLVNIVVALVALGFVRREAPAPADAAPAPARAAGALMSLAAFVSGAGFLAMEIVWYRMLAPLLGGSIYTMGLILVVVLAGIGIGGAVDSRRWRASVATLFVLQALAVGLPIVLGDRIVVWAALLNPTSLTSFWSRVAGWTAIAAVVVLPASFVSGMIFPALIARVGVGRRDVAVHTGNITFWNTLGGVLGSLVAGLWLIPRFSAPAVWSGVTCVFAITGVLVAIAEVFERPGRALLATGLAAGWLVVVWSATGPTAAWRHSPVGAGRFKLQGLSPNQIVDRLNATRRDIRIEADGRESTVGVASNFGYSLLMNGKSDGNAFTDAETCVMLGLIPATLHPAPERALVVGLGLGLTAGWLAAADGVRHVDVVELEPRVVEAARLCAIGNKGALDDPKVKLHIGDAREFLLATRGSYDLIVSEPSNPYRAGVASLFSHEFYQAATRILRPGGMFAQWVQGYEVSLSTLATIVATMHRSFSHVEIWRVGGDDLVVVASNGARWPSLDRIREACERAPLRDALARISKSTVGLEGFLSFYAAGPEFTSKMAGGGFGPTRINSDDRLVIEFDFARSVGPNETGGDRLAETARDLGADRPPGAGSLNWDLVRQHRNLRVARPFPPWARVSQVDRAMRDAFCAFSAGSYEPVRANVGRIPALSPMAKLMLGEALAVIGDARSLTYADEIAPILPLEATGIRGLMALNKKDHVTGIRHMSELFHRMRREPWVWRGLSSVALKATAELAKDQLAYREQVLEMLSQPFAMLDIDEHRQAALVHALAGTGDVRAATMLEAFEPHVPWNRFFLEMRALEYARASSAGLLDAYRDLEVFRGQEDPRDAVRQATLMSPKLNP